MAEVEMRDELSCTRCPAGPFKARSGLGAHMVAKHGVRLDGTPAPAGNRRRKTKLTHEVVASIKGQEITLRLDDAELRKLLEEHATSVVDSLLS